MFLFWFRHSDAPEPLVKKIPKEFIPRLINSEVRKVFLEIYMKWIRVPNVSEIRFFKMVVDFQV